MVELAKFESTAVTAATGRNIENAMYVSRNNKLENLYATNFGYEPRDDAGNGIFWGSNIDNRSIDSSRSPLGVSQCEWCMPVSRSLTSVRVTSKQPCISDPQEAPCRGRGPLGLFRSH